MNIEDKKHYINLFKKKFKSLYSSYDDTSLTYYLDQSKLIVSYAQLLFFGIEENNFFVEFESYFNPHTNPKSFF